MVHLDVRKPHGQCIGPLHGTKSHMMLVCKFVVQNNAARTSPPGPAVVLEVPLRNLFTTAHQHV